VKGRGGEEGKVKTGGENRRKGQKKNSWGREGRVGQERAKQVGICTERKRVVVHGL
jgi:hypothetical protein